MVIDTHIHPALFAPICEDQERFRRRCDAMNYHLMKPSDMALLRKQYALADIGRVVLLPEDCSVESGMVEISNDEIAKLVALDAQFYIGMAAVDPRRPDAVQELERAFAELGLAGLAVNTARLKMYPMDERLVPLYEEFALLNDYFTIQQYRYGGTITLDVSYIEDESLNHSCLIPRFTLQPLVENAIFHGIEPKGSAGEVTLRVERDTANGDVLIHLTDDGVGMTPEQAAKALQEPGPEEAAAKYRHVGMWNVHKRLQYSFGEAYGLSIESEPDIGTTVTIRLPGPDSQK